MKIKAVDYSMYRVSDLETSIAFYRDILGLGSFDFDESKVGGRAYIALAVDDVEVAVAELTKKGVKIEGDIWDFPSVCNGVIFLDPDGNRIALHHRKDGSVG